MRKVLFIVICTLLFYSSTAFAFKAPTSIAGISLDKNYNNIRSMLDIDSIDSQWNEDYLKRIEVMPLEGYRSGYIVVGTCQRKDTILKIKLNYKDDSVKFYNKLYNRITKLYGKPIDWRGNPFGTLKVWKWSFKDSNGNITLILHHFSGEDDSMTQGNSIKISRPEMINDERLCWEKNHPDSNINSIPAKIKGMGWYTPY